MALKHADRVFAFLLLLGGLYITVMAYRYGLYRNNVPGPGFFPFGAGLGLTVLAAAILFRSLRTDFQPSVLLDTGVLLAILGVIAALSAFALAAPVLGITISAFIAMVWIGWVSEEADRKSRAFFVRLVLTSAAIAAGCHFIFATLIGVPLINGPLGF